MSASTDGRRGPLFSINPGIGFSADDGGTVIEGGVYDKLEAFVSAARRIEQALVQERGRTKKLQEDLRQTQTTYDRLLGESEARARENQIAESKVRAALTELEKREQAQAERERQVQAELRKTTEELARYRAAWSQVLQREREAKMILRDSADLSKRRDELEARARGAEGKIEEEKRLRQQAERHAKSYQSELQSALIRLHSAEAKFSELTQEYQALQQSRRQVDEEVARIEASVRERADWEFAKERERLRAELEREYAVEREKFREETRRSIQAELQQAATAERNRMDRERDAFLVELACAKESAFQARKETDSVRADAAQDRSMANAALATAHRAESEAARLKNQLSSARAEATVLRVTVEKQKEALSQCETEIRFARAETERQRGEIADFEGELERLRGQYTELSVGFDAHRAELETELARAAAERSDLSRAVEEAVQGAAAELVERVRIIEAVRAALVQLQAADVGPLFSSHLGEQSRALDSCLIDADDDARESLVSRKNLIDNARCSLEEHSRDLAARWTALDAWLADEARVMEAAAPRSE